MNPVQIKLRKKYRFAVYGNHKSSHNNGVRHRKMAKHGLWTTPGSKWFSMYGGKLPPPQPARKMVLENGRIRMELV